MMKNTKFLVTIKLSGVKGYLLNHLTAMLIFNGLPIIDKELQFREYFTYMPVIEVFKNTI